MTQEVGKLPVKSTACCCWLTVQPAVWWVCQYSNICRQAVFSPAVPLQLQTVQAQTYGEEQTCSGRDGALDGVACTCDCGKIEKSHKTKLIYIDMCIDYLHERIPS